jgi:hypothetical protein
VSDRSADAHPDDRWSDRVGGWKKLPAWFWHHKLYRDIWLLLVTIAIALGFNAIHESRIDTSVRACEDSNARHVATIKKLNALYEDVTHGQLEVIQAANTPDKIAALPKDLRQPASSYQSTVGLIDALAPHVDDCQARAESLINP